MESKMARPKKIKPPAQFWRTISPNGETYQYDTREECEAGAQEVANRFNGSAPIEEWSADYPQDELNQGWACVGAKYAPGKEPLPRPGRRTGAKDVPIGSDSEVWGFTDTNARSNGGRASWHRGIVWEVRRHDDNPLLNTEVVFDDGRRAWCVEYAVAHVLKEDQ